MSPFLIHIKTAWNDYFTGNPTLIQTKEYYGTGQTQTLSDTNVYVLNCLFRSMTSGSHGGALSCTSVTCLLVESTSFFSCKTSNRYGGAIYFHNRNSGQCVLYEVCGYDCCSTSTGDSSSGQFSNVYVYDATSNKNYVNYSSISRCVTDYSNSWYMTCHSFGKICFPSVNISLNKCQYRSGIYCCPYKDLNSVTCSFSYSTFADNIAIGYTCIILWTSGMKHEIKSCNILRNTQGSLDSEGTIYTVGDVIILNSCILENTATYIFHQGDSSYPITVSNCTVDSTSKYGNVVTQNTVTKSFIHALNHMSTLNCHSEYDSAGTLTPIIQHSKKQKPYFSCEILFNQHCLREFSSFHSIFIFIFNFIHSFSSNDR
jgi:hypothetical protein